MSHIVTGTQKLQHLQTDLEKGRLKIPQFQRDFVWDVEKAASLIDSIIRGYPIGELIYWQTTDRLREVRDLGRLNFPEADKGEGVFYVLDGQQRLTSIIAALLGLTVTLRNGAKRDFSSILVHLNTKDVESPIIRTDHPEEDDAFCLPLTQVWKRKGEEYDACQNKMRDVRDNLSTRLITYEIPKVTLLDADLSIATEVFSRINTSGLDLTVFEIMVAKTFHPDKDFDLVEKFDEFSEDLKDAGFETIDASDVLKLIALMLKGDCKKKTILSLDRLEFIATWHDAIESLKAAVDYIKTSFRIPVSRLLPYPAQIIPFALFFNGNGKKPPSKLQAKLLADFFWMAGWSERYSSSSDSKLAQDKRMIDKFLKSESVRFDWLANVDVKRCRDASFSASQAFSKTILALLASMQPQKYNSGALVNLQNDWMRRADSMNFHHIFPKSYLKTKGYDDWEINRVLNISLVDDFINKRVIRGRPPSDYMNEFKEHNEDFEGTMTTHLIQTHNQQDSEQDSAAIWSDNFERFIDERASDIVSLLKSKLIN